MRGVRGGGCVRSGVNVNEPPGLCGHFHVCADNSGFVRTEIINRPLHH
jgi:hypothetical protein